MRDEPFSRGVKSRSGGGTLEESATSGLQEASTAEMVRQLGDLSPADVHRLSGAVEIDLQRPLRSLKNDVTVLAMTQMARHAGLNG